MKDKILALKQSLKSKISSERGDIGDSFMIIILQFCDTLQSWMSIYLTKNKISKNKKIKH